MTASKAHESIYSHEASAEDRACRHLWGVLFVLLGAATAALMVVSVSFGRSKPPGADLTFVGVRDYKSKIFMLDTDHGFAHNLTRIDTGEDSPAWSPDGKRLAFVSWRDRHRNLFVLDVETRATLKISNLRVALHDRPVWSPDSRRVAFEVEQGGDIDLAIADLDAGAVEMLAASPEQERYPVWSPDGQRIAFVSWRGGNAEIYVADLTCGGSLCADPVDVTHSHGADAEPSWSPDGRSIAFLSDRNGHREVYVMDADCDAAVSCNRRVRRLSDDQVEFNDLIWAAPVWSPDGRRLVYLSSRDDVSVQIFAVDVADARRSETCCDFARQLTTGPWVNANVAWSADGRQLAFTSERGGNWDIYLMDAATGGNLRRLTWNPDDDYAPTWVPPVPRQSLLPTSLTFLNPFQ